MAGQQRPRAVHVEKHEEDKHCEWGGSMMHNGSVTAGQDEQGRGSCRPTPTTSPITFPYMSVPANTRQQKKTTNLYTDKRHLR